MSKTILITGSTDGIGLLAAQTLSGQGHTVLLHGRSAEKLTAARAKMQGETATYQADLSARADVDALAASITADHGRLDVLINNAGVLKAPNPILPDGKDIRFVVNTIAPYALTKALLPIIPRDGRILNLSSAAQAPVDVQAMGAGARMDDMGAYAQSKLAITIWSQELAKSLPDGPSVIAVNPGSLLATKMVKEGFGIAGSDISKGADILCRLALEPEFAEASGRYWDNDAGGFGPPHPGAADPAHVAAVMEALDALV